MVICRNCGHTNSDKVILTDLNNRNLCNKCFKELLPSPDKVKRVHKSINDCLKGITGVKK